MASPRKPHFFEIQISKPLEATHILIANPAPITHSEYHSDHSKHSDFHGVERSNTVGNCGIYCGSKSVGIKGIYVITQ